MLDESGHPEANNKTVMVIDDEERIRKILRIQLEREGYKVIDISDGKEAIELLTQTDVDIVITDIRMPFITGNQILRHIKMHSPTVPVIMLTGVVDLETAVAIMRDGAYDYLVKPVKKDELIITVQKAFQYRQLVLKNLKLQEENIKYQQDLERKVRERTRELTRTLAQLREIYLDTVRILASAIEEKDIYTRGHSQRTRILSAEMARRIGYREPEVERVEYAALLHDIGKIAIDQRILEKPGPLTFEERKIIQEHPIIGERIVRKADFFTDIAPWIRSHHERWDGLGYPDGLKEEEIPLPSRIMAVADAFDAMSSNRPYRKAFPLEQAIETIKRESGKQFCPDMASLFIDEQIYKIPCTE